MQIYKALITDLDGTVVELSSDGHDVSDIARMAVKRAQDSGSKIACATGRRWSFAKPVIEKLGITGPCIVEGGTRIIESSTEETLWEKHLDPSSLSVILEIFKSKTSQGKISTFQNLPSALQSVTSVPDDARFMYLLGLYPDIAADICNAINGNGYAVAHMTPSWSGGNKMDVHVTHPEATKEHAVQVWQQLEGVTKAETIGMGDSGNDIPLFESVGLSVAVGNATPELKQLADYIAPAQNQEALAHIIDRYLISN